MAAECLVKFNLATSKRLLVRVLRATFNQSRRHNQNYSLIRIDMTSPVRPVDAAATCKVLIRITASSALTALKAGKLESLGAQETGGMVKITRSRVGQAQLGRLLGTDHLPVVMPSKLLGLHMTEDNHAQDHRLTIKDVIARVRQTVLIPGGKKLAK